MSKFQNILIMKGLSNKESEIVEMVVKGLSNKEIANQFFLSEKTIKFYLKNIYLKIHIRNRQELILGVSHWAKVDPVKTVDPTGVCILCWISSRISSSNAARTIFC